MSVLVCFSALQRVVGSIQGPFLWMGGAVLASSVCKKCQLCFLLAYCIHFLPSNYCWDCTGAASGFCTEMLPDLPYLSHHPQFRAVEFKTSSHFLELQKNAEFSHLLG